MTATSMAGSTLSGEGEPDTHHAMPAPSAAPAPGVAPAPVASETVGKADNTARWLAGGALTLAAVGVAAAVAGRRRT